MSIHANIFVFIHEYSYNNMSMYTRVNVQIYLFESYK